MFSFPLALTFWILVRHCFLFLSLIKCTTDWELEFQLCLQRMSVKSTSLVQVPHSARWPICRLSRSGGRNSTPVQICSLSEQSCMRWRPVHFPLGETRRE